MLHILIVRYTVPADQVTPHVAEHVAYLEHHHADGTFLLSGQTVPADIGGVILAQGERASVEGVSAEDPFVAAGVAEHEVITVDPGRVDPSLATLLPRAR
ncbi:YciI family protein [Nocardiopsis sediminis]|uniref:YciI family protein n=1 Tax=Nocardiopsis sediminis TaxID=1778267 RepID=A0ABV8FSN8_9ACTN